MVLRSDSVLGLPLKTEKCTLFSNDDYIGVKRYFLDNDWSIQSVVLTAKAMKEGLHIATRLKELATTNCSP